MQELPQQTLPIKGWLESIFPGWQEFSSDVLRDYLHGLWLSGENFFISPRTLAMEEVVPIGKGAYATVTTGVRMPSMFYPAPIDPRDTLEFDGHKPAGPIQYRIASIAKGNCINGVPEHTHESLQDTLNSIFGTTVDYTAATDYLTDLEDAIDWHCSGRHGAIYDVSEDELDFVVGYINYFMGGKLGDGIWYRKTGKNLRNIEFVHMTKVFPPPTSPWNWCGKSVLFDKVVDLDFIRNQKE